MASVTINTKDFADPNFNPKKWINSILKASPNTEEGEDDGSKNITVIVTKLQMESESTSRQFDQLSSQIIKSMPRMLYDLKTISDSAKTTHQKVETIKSSLGLVESHTEKVIDNLRRPHVAKTRMEECRMILLEKSDHLNKLREEQEQKLRQEAEEAERREAEARAEAEAAARAKKEALEAIEQEETERLLAEKQEALLREQERLKQQKEEAEKEAARVEAEKAAKQPIDELSEEEEDDYGHVQLPPLRQPEPKTRTTTLQQLNTNTRTQQPEENNSYLQQVTPQVSSVFKRIGVPLDKFWQS